MTFEDVRKYEEKMQAETNEKVQAKIQGFEVKTEESVPASPTSSIPSSPTCKSPTQSNARSWFSWS